MSGDRPAGDDAPPFATLAVVGLGLIGASVALAARAAWPGIRILAADARPDAVEQACRAGVVDGVVADVVAAAAQADLLLLAVPVRALPAQLDALAACVDVLAARGTVVSDVGSTKGSLLAAAAARFGAAPAWLVPGHPLAGSEHSGWAAGRADLFRQRRLLLCPTAANAVALERVRMFWHGLGAQVECMGAAEHDALLAQTSHLPHMLSYALVDALLEITPAAQLFHYSGGGFRDMTRLAASDAVMWRDVALDNRDALLAALDRFAGTLAALRADIAAGDGAALEARFRRTKAARDAHLKEVD